MKMVKSLLLGTAAGLVAVAGAQAADLPVKAKPVQYVKICSLYGAGFYYIPGTDTCIKIGGYVRAEWNYQAANSFKPRIVYNFDDPARDRYNERTRGGITVDVRSQTAYGTLRAYAVLLSTFSEDGGPGGSPYANAGLFSPAIFIQWAGFTFGKTASFFDFDSNPYTNATVWLGSAQGGNGIQVFAYTAQFGNGFSASLSAEDTTVRRSSIVGAAATTSAYGGRRFPDVVANLRIDQAWGSAQIMGGIHDVYSNNTVSNVTDSDMGWAIGAGLRINLPMIGAGDYIIGQVNYSEGATNYAISQAGAGGLVANLADGLPGTVAGTRAAVGYIYDAVNVGAAGTNNVDLTKAWSFTAGFEHKWNSQWKSSLYGSYGKFTYSTAASAVISGNLAGFAATGNTSADWSMWQVGSRTVWTPVANLDLSVDVLYTKVNTGFEGSSATALGTFRDNDIWSAMFRAQRNFWP
jgi:hypothetical protein